MVSLIVRQFLPASWKRISWSRALVALGAYAIAFGAIPFLLLPKLVPEPVPQINYQDNQVVRWDGSRLAGGTLYDTGSAVGIGTAEPRATLTLHPEKSFDFAALSSGNEPRNDIYLGYVSSPGFGSFGMCTMDACVASNGTSLNFGWVNGPDSMSDDMVFSPNGQLWVRGGYSSGSDARMKKDVAEVGERWQSLLKLRPVSFRWKEETMDPGVHFGLIAQEARAWVPELVREEGADHMLSIEYAGLIPLLIEAAKHLTARNDALARQVDVLAQRVSTLATENRELEARIAGIQANQVAIVGRQ